MATAQSRELLEIVKRNRRRLFSRRASDTSWDRCIVTASTPEQAAFYRMALAERQERGLIPATTEVVAISDPTGAKVGSGGGLLWALQTVPRASAGTGQGARRECGERILVIQCGGESRRSPLHAATGKLFAALPWALPDGVGSTVFDELWTVLQPIAGRVSAGVVVAAGDVLLALDPDTLELPSSGVFAVACWADAETGSGHGVYVPGEQGEVRAFLQKATPGQLQTAGAMDSRGCVPVDSGILGFVGRGAQALVELAGGTDVPALVADLGCPLDLYTHFIAALVGQKSWAEGQQAFSQLAFRVLVAEPSLFVHLGSTHLFRERLTRDRQMRAVFAARRITDSSLSEGKVSRSAAVMGSALRGAEIEAEKGSVVAGVHGRGRLVVEEGAVVVEVDASECGLRVRPDVVLLVLPVALGKPPDQRRHGWVGVLYGVTDDPRYPVARAECTFLGSPFRAWLEARDIEEHTVWSDIPPTERSLWNARCFPVCRDATTALQQVLWMQEARPLRAEVQRWQQSPRVSLADLAGVMDPERLVRRHVRLRGRIAADRAIEDIERCGDLEIARLLRGLPGSVGREARRLLRQYAEELASGTPECPVAALHRSRALRTLAEAAPGCAQRKTLTRQAFEALAQAVTTPREGREPATLGVRLGQGVVVEAPVRVDLAGGWSDTPPYCLERTGAVVNVALNLGGKAPIRVVARALEEPIVRLRSEDQNVELEATRLEQLQDYARPGDPLAIPKAALFCVGVVCEQARASLPKRLSEFAAGVELRTRCTVPKGSGLGASSIVGAACLAALQGLCGCQRTQAELMQEVLSLEQMLTTGGGWQDQVGGVVGGLKLTTSSPGLPQKLSTRPLEVAPEVHAELRERLVLFYTGRTRIARDILHSVMGRYLLREKSTVRALRKVESLALEMAAAFEIGDLDEVGRLMSEQWECNKVLDPGSTDDHLESLFEAVRGHVSGAKLAGAGGGGFMVLMRKGGPQAPTAAWLTRRLLGRADGSACTHSVNEKGLVQWLVD